MLKVMKAIEDVVDKYSDDYRFINDHELNVVCQIDTDEERIEFILAAIDEQLPAGIIFSHEYTCGEYEITFKEIKGDDIMNEYVIKANILDASIHNEFGPLDWVDQTLDQDGDGNYTGHYHISFTGPRIKKDETCRSAGFRGREDGFFAKMHRIKEMIKNCGMTADLIKFYADNECPYSEATINIHLDGGEL